MLMPPKQCLFYGAGFLPLSQIVPHSEKETNCFWEICALFELPKTLGNILQKHCDNVKNSTEI